jgi:hypothetical protein
MPLRRLRGMRIAGPRGPEARPAVATDLSEMSDMVTPAAVAAGRISLNVGTILQDSAYWCWAACIQMMLQRPGPTPQQSEIVTRLYQFPYPGPLPVWDVELAWHEWGFSCQGIGARILATDIENNLKNQAAVQVEISNAGSGHLVLITGIFPDGDLQINDPAGLIVPPKYPYAALLANWFNTWVGIKRAGGTHGSL